MTATNDSLPVEIARHYGLKQEQLYLLTDNSDDGVYGFVKAGQPFVLKCTPATVRAEATIRGQVAWLHYLAKQGARVCQVLPSPQGKLVEGLAIEDKRYSLVCYEEVKGRRPEGADLTAALFRQWGELLGAIHALSSRYRPEPEAGPLPEWAEAARQWPQAIPADQGLVLAQYTRLMAELDSLPKSQETYGLIHGDFQANNLRLDQGRVTVFDFDDCAYHWFAADIAICLYFTLWEPHPGQDNRSFAAFFLDNFLAGYQDHHCLDDSWFGRLRLFLKLQEMAIYVALNQFHQVAQRGLHKLIPPKHYNLLTRYRHNIEQGIPYLESAYNPWVSSQ